MTAQTDRVRLLSLGNMPLTHTDTWGAHVRPWLARPWPWYVEDCPAWEGWIVSGWRFE